MKRSIYLLALLALIAIASGTLMAGASWIGRVGITFLHKEYNFLKIWWQGATAVFLIYLILTWLHSRISTKLPSFGGRIVHLLILGLTIAGFYFTYDDFHHTLSHRLLGRKFHYGAYLFWVGWMVICIYYLLRRNRPAVIAQDKTATITL